MRLLISMAIFLASLMMAACAGQQHRLSDKDDPAVADGWFNYQPSEGWVIVLQYAGKRFDSHGAEVRRRQNRDELKKQYGAGSKHFARIFSGVDTDHYEYSVNHILRSKDDDMLFCLISWKAATRPAGNCITAEGKFINIRFM